MELDMVIIFAIFSGCLFGIIQNYVFMLKEARLLDLGRISFEDAWSYQKDCVRKRAAGEIEDTILVCEHGPVYTFGRNFKQQLPVGLPFPVYQIERGGQGTYHGPGQLMIYPIVKLQMPKILAFIRSLEQFVMDLAAQFGVPSHRRDGATGVWVGERKLASIGIAVTRSVTYHGAALNVNPDLSHFAAIQPCGYDSSVMTSLSAELDQKITVQDVMPVILRPPRLRSG